MAPRRAGQADHRSDRSDKAQASKRLLDALAEIERSAGENAERSQAVKRRAAEMRRGLEAGTPLTDLVAAEPRPRIVELLSTNMATLETAGAELRVAQAIALRHEGLTIERIAELFGVTRQRISALLKQRPKP
jgi:hypothetical protein